MADQCQRRLFTALCRRYGLERYRYKGQRHTTVVVRAPRSFVDNTLWPEYILSSPKQPFLPTVWSRPGHTRSASY